MNNVPLDRISSTAWAELVGTQFRIQIEGGQPVQLTLANVNPGPIPFPATGEPNSPKSESFSLLFKGPINPALRQKTYHFEHAGLGRFELFIVPTARSSAECEYEAVFTRFPQSARAASRST